MDTLAPAADETQPDESPDVRPWLLSESSVVIVLLEAALLVQQREDLKQLLDLTMDIDMRAHESDSMGNLSAFATLGFDAYGHLHLHSIDTASGMVKLALRTPSEEPLFVWTAPVSFFVDDEGRRPTAQQRVMALVRAAFEALERSGWVAESLAARAAANDAARRPVAYTPLCWASSAR